VSAAESDGDDLGVDGRTARRDRNRDAVLDAVLDLFRDDNLVPGVAEVAERSGVSARSVFRYFEDADELVRLAIRRQLERVGHLFEMDGEGEGALDVRIDRLVEARLDLYDAIAPVARAAMLRAASNPLIAERMEERRRFLKTQLQRHFAPELTALPKQDRPGALAALDVLCGFEGIEQLRRNEGLRRADARRALVWSLRRILAT
jgi:AcrR family transcriptional regulator